ncbi:periplasmic chaperone for outer membrane proteins SurA [Hoeflea marina]|uniref:Periplasmic chaperone for outer membrane proteins SurA n=1 Tax=Hoeflea marina TaxID=274592 RepID=A0A317PMX8_9HYPH|nr:peptidylprolyl isomerase [Hoeflea marina]PWW02285.1 periplasmic chaperone for outer membrane proteins SurA [Hoeflea marina]
MKIFATFRITGLAAATVLALLAAPATQSPAFAASEIKIIVNNQAITSVDIARRVAFLRLQRAKGASTEMARKQLVDEALKLQEARRLGAIVPDAQVDASFDRFANSNKMTGKQMSQVLAQAGVTAGHFKNFIRVQMSWPRVVQARYGGGGGKMSGADLVAKMLESGGEKPSTTEYILQQVIFVVPAAKRSNSMIAARKREADQLRGRYSGCEGTREVAVSLRDVTVRELGRFLQPQLPPDWKPLIEKTKAGQATTARVTDRGIEFIGVCSTKTVSDDVAAEMVFRAENTETDESQNSKDFLEDLRKRAVIANR